MKHVKKMILLPHDAIDRMSTPTPQRTHLNALDTDIQTILDKQYADDSEKWKHYNEALQRYLHFKNEANKPVKIELVTENTNHVEETSKKQQQEDNIKKQLFSVLPKTMREQGGKLYDYLSEDPNLSWDATGRVAISGHDLPHSNIIDLVSHTVRNRKQSHPEGVSEFTKALAASNIPLEYIGNEKLRANILDAKYHFTPNKTSTPKPGKKHKSHHEVSSWTHW